MKKEVALIGTGNMAVDYLNVIKDLDINLTVIGRGIESCKTFYEKTGYGCVSGGLEHFVEKNSEKNWSNVYIIIAVGTESLMECLLLCGKLNPKSILIEKPGAISVEELINNEIGFREYSHKVFIAYNRRFYSSVMYLEKLLRKDGGLVSVNFEFTEWVDTITPLKKAVGVKENWLFANSTHVIDLAFYLCGFPAKICSFVSKSSDISWHKNSTFSGAGITKNNIPFSYYANWESAGRWGIEICTNQNKYYLRPLEKIFVQKRGSIGLEEVIFNDDLDKKYKPGLFLQTKAFLDNDVNRLISIKEQVVNSLKIYKIIQEGNC